MSSFIVPDRHSDIMIYTTDDGLVKIETTFDGDTVWLSKAQMAELFQRDRSVISKHIKNVFGEGELAIEGNVQNLHIANSDKPVEFYNLDVIISVGYRVKSKRGVQFRIWAVFCKYFLDKVAKHFWTLLHVQIGQNCNGVSALYRADQYSHCRHYLIVTA
jgi:hypothetical protein